jgi:hypothetical protein
VVNASRVCTSEGLHIAVDSLWGRATKTNIEALARELTATKERGRNKKLMRGPFFLKKRHLKELNKLFKILENFRALNFADQFINYSFIDIFTDTKQKALETIRPAFDDMAKGDQVLKSKFHSMFDMMYERKQNYFSADNRFIVDYRLEENREGFYLQVASTPLKT